MQISLSDHQFTDERPSGVLLFPLGHGGQCADCGVVVVGPRLSGWPREWSESEKAVV